MLRFLIWFIFLIGGAALGILLDLHLFSALWHNIWFHLGTLLPGLLFLRAVMIISRNTGRYLARHGREGNIPRMTTNRLVTTGIYSCMRHPMHLGLLLFPWSVALIIGSTGFILIIAPLEMLLILALIKWVEEPEAIRKFGKEYLDYKNRVPMFSLRKKCLKMLFLTPPPTYRHRADSR